MKSNLFKLFIRSLFLLTLFVAFSYNIVSAQSDNKKPLIGISSYSESDVVKAGRTYIESVRKAGGIAIVIPITTNVEQIDEILERIDALVMIGGEDLSPFYYKEEPNRFLGEVAPERDVFDIELIKKAHKKGIPILGVCRGEQALNVALGGTLFQDIPSQVSGSVQHNQKAPRNYGAHSIKVEENTLLYSLLKKGLDKNNHIRVNSFHHQAVKDLGKGLKITARALDGVVEAIESEDGKALGVQFHPEGFVYSGDDTFLPIFKWIVDKAKE